jgi:CcmD family protein
MIEGGWSYVWAAYLVTWLGLGIYAASLLLRRRELEREAPPSAKAEIP